MFMKLVNFFLKDSMKGLEENELKRDLWFLCYSVYWSSLYI